MKTKTRTDRHGPFAYTPLVYSSFLGKSEKSLLLYYANHYNWKNDEASYHSEARICGALPMNPRTYRAARKSLKELGWIEEWREFIPGLENVVIRVRPMLGRDDPKIFADRGGRPPRVQEKHQQLIEDFRDKHPNLCTTIRVQKLAYSEQSQSIRVQKLLFSGQEALTNYESIRPSIMKLNELITSFG